MYSFSRSFLCPFLFVFSLIFLILFIPFLEMRLNFYPLVIFSLSYALIFNIPMFFFDRLLKFFGADKNKESISLKIVCNLVVISFFIVALAFTFQSVTLQLGYNNLIGNPSALALIVCLGGISVLFAVLFSFIFIFGEANE